MRVAVDGMGGDNAPDAVVKGCLAVLEQTDDIEISLVGRSDVLSESIQRISGKSGEDFAPRLTIVHAQDVVTMDDKPSIALRQKKDNSIARSVKLLADKEVDAAVSAGNTAALVGVSSYVIGMIKGAKRPGVAVPLPARGGSCTIIDLGANIACKAQHLYQYGIMASAYSEKVLGLENPRVGLVNIGTEDSKGIDMIVEANKLFKDSDLNYVGYVEGNEIFLGGCDVAVCEGFLGNILLKAIEGFSTNFIHTVIDEIKKLFAGDAEKQAVALSNFKKRTDWKDYGGAPLLGLDGVVILAHGKSDAVAIANSIIRADQLAKSGLNEYLLARLT